MLGGYKATAVGKLNAAVLASELSSVVEAPLPARVHTVPPPLLAAA